MIQFKLMFLLTIFSLNTWAVSDNLKLLCKKVLSPIKSSSVLKVSSEKLAKIIAVDEETQKLISNPKVAKYIYLHYFATDASKTELKVVLDDLSADSKVGGVDLYKLVNETLEDKLEDPKIHQKIKELESIEIASLRPGKFRVKADALLSRAKQVKGLPHTISKIKKMIRSDFSQDKLDESLFHFYGATQLGLADSQLRKWDVIPGGFSAIKPAHIQNMSPAVWSSFAHFTSETEHPILGYSRNSGEATRGLMPSLSIFLGKTLEEAQAREQYEEKALAEGKTLSELEQHCTHVWCREEDRHDGAIGSFGEHVSGQRHRIPQTYEADSIGDYSSSRDAIRHLVGRMASEWNANSVYFFLRAHSVGATNQWVDQIRKDETKHLAIFDTVFKYLYGNQPNLRVKGMLEKIMIMKNAASETNSNSASVLSEGLSVFELFITHLFVESNIRKFVKTVPLKTMEKLFDSPVRTLHRSESLPVPKEKKKILKKMIAKEKARRERLERWKPKERELYLSLKRVEETHAELIEGLVLNLFSSFKGAEVLNSAAHKEVLRIIDKLNTGLDKKINKLIKMSLRETLRDYQIMNNRYVQEREDLIVRFESASTGFIVSHKNKKESKVLLLKKLSDNHHLIRVEKVKGLNVSVGSAMRVTLQTSKGDRSRILSLASSPEAPYFEFAVGDSSSNFKKAFRRLKKDDYIEVELVSEGLNFDFNSPMVMIAGGIGITPFRSAIQYHTDKKLKKPLYLLYGNRTQIPFKPEFVRAENTNPLLNVTNVLSQGSSSWTEHRGRIDANFLRNEIREFPEEAKYYIVGSIAMVESLQKALVELGVDSKNINIEVFNNTAVSSVNNSKDTARVVKDENFLCRCHGVSAETIQGLIDSGSKTLSEIQNKSMAGTGCGGCKCTIKAMCKKSH